MMQHRPASSSIVQHLQASASICKHRSAAAGPEPWLAVQDSNIGWLGLGGLQQTRLGRANGVSLIHGLNHGSWQNGV